MMRTSKTVSARSIGCRGRACGDTRYFCTTYAMGACRCHLCARFACSAFGVDAIVSGVGAMVSVGKQPYSVTTVIVVAWKIFDRSGTLLVYNEPSFTLWMNDERQSDSSAYVRMVRQSADLLGVDEFTMHDALIDITPSHGVLLVASNVTYESAMRVLAAPEIYEGFEVRLGTKRMVTYPRVTTLSGILGYVGLINEEEYAARKGRGMPIKTSREKQVSNKRTNHSCAGAPENAKWKRMPSDKRLPYSMNGNRLTALISRFILMLIFRKKSKRSCKRARRNRRIFERPWW